MRTILTLLSIAFFMSCDNEKQSSNGKRYFANGEEVTKEESDRYRQKQIAEIEIQENQKII